LLTTGCSAAEHAVRLNWQHIVNLYSKQSCPGSEKEELMHDPSSAAAEKALAVKPTSGDASPEHEIARSSVPRQHRSRQAIESDAERIRSAVMRLMSNSIGELEGLTAELQKLQDFLKCETERVQQEIDSVLSGVSIIVETIAPWKNPISAIQNSPANPTNQGPSARDKLKRWPAPPAE
jgi:hypothetical protein